MASNYWAGSDPSNPTIPGQPPPEEKPEPPPERKPDPPPEPPAKKDK